MGFYSFYKTLKDIFITILGKKTYRGFLIIVIVLIVIFVLGFQNYSNASTSNNVPVTFENGSSIYVSLPSYIFENNLNFAFFGLVKNTGFCCYDLFVSTGNIYYTRSSNGSTHYFQTDAGSTYYFFSSASSNSPDGSFIQNGLNNVSFSNPKIANTNPLSWGGNDYGRSSSYFGDPTFDNGNFTINLFSNVNILNKTDNTVLYEKNYPINILPQIYNSENDFTTLLFDVVAINGGDYSTQDLYFLCYDKNFEGTDNLNNIYPVKTFLLNQRSKYFIPERTENPSNGAIYWINRDEIGFNWEIGNTYAFRFAIRTPVESEFTDWAYEYIGDEYVFTVSSDVLQGQIDDLNSQTKEKEEQLRHEETVNSINNINNFLNSDTNEDTNEEIDSLMDITSDNEDLKDINTGFFSRLSTFLTNFLDYNYLEDELLEIPLPHSTQKIIIHSNILSSHLSNTLSTIIGMFWMYIFTLYGIKFTNNLLIAIQEGDIIDPNKNLVGAFKGEVILSNML